MDIGKLFFTWEGRIGRQEFWLAWLAIFAANIIFGWVPIIGALVGLVGLYCHICVYAKRLHDLGRTGWVQLATYIPYAVALVLSIYAIVALIAAGVTWDDIPNIFAMTFGVGGVFVALLAWLLAFLIDLAFLLWLGIAEPQPYENAYGPARVAADPYKDALPIV